MAPLPPADSLPDMEPAIVSSRLAPADVASIDQLIAVATLERGYRPVSDQFWLDLHNAHEAPAISVRFHDQNRELLAYVQGSNVGNEWTFESVTFDDGQVAGAALSRALDVALNSAADSGGSEVVWLVQGPTAQHELIASVRGLAPDRHLHQMRRAIPTGLPFQIATREFDPARDVNSWVAVNARAFAWNPEQGGWTAESLRARMSEPWFDPAGFLIHERDGRLAGFCWTKVHPGTANSLALGEIYVVAVDPDFHGFGLGRDLTLAGLEHLAGRGIRTGMLYVDGDNVAAIRVYDRLGFVIHRTDSMFRGTLPSCPPQVQLESMKAK